MKFLRRFVWYLAGRLLLVCVLLGLMTVTFYFSMNATNIYIVLKDGMARRAQVVMMGADAADLTKYFQPAFIEWDETLQIALRGDSPYRYYSVRGIDHRLELQWMWCWPWEDSARADFVERIPRVDGKPLSQYRQQLQASTGEESPSVPKWTAGRYRATLVRENGQWRIKSLSQTGQVE